MGTGADYTDRDTFRCQLITWSEAVRMSRELANLVHMSGFKPDLIIAIGRGGYVPARIVCDYLLFKDLISIRIEHWGVAATLDKEARIRFGLSTDISGLKVLLLDDITDTGDTLVAALNYLKAQGPAQIMTAVLQHKTCSVYIPDFYVHRIVKWRWIIYPWAIFEDLSGFIGRVMGSTGMSSDTIRQRLLQNFQLSVNTRELNLLLEQMSISGMVEKTQTGDTVIWKLQD